MSLTLASISVPCSLAQGSGHLQAGAPQTVVGKRGAAVQAKIPVSVDPGFHVNSDKPKEEFLIPLSLTWTSAGALEPGASGLSQADHGEGRRSAAFGFHRQVRFDREFQDCVEALRRVQAQRQES